MRWLIQGYKANGRARIKMEFPVSSLLFTDFYFLLPSDKFTPSTVLNTWLVSPDKGCYQEGGGAAAQHC